MKPNTNAPTSANTAKNFVPNGYHSDMQNIKEDLVTLKDDAATLVQHVAQDGQKKISDAASMAGETFSAMKESGVSRLKDLEHEVTARPLQSVLIAFGAGIVASYLLGGRR